MPQLRCRLARRNHSVRGCARWVHGGLGLGHSAGQAAFVSGGLVCSLRSAVAGLWPLA